MKLVVFSRILWECTNFIFLINLWVVFYLAFNKESFISELDHPMTLELNHNLRCAKHKVKTWLFDDLRLIL